MDLLVKGGRNHARTVNVLKALYPELEVRSFVDATAFFLPGETESVIDVAYSHRADLEATLASAVWTVNKKHGLRHRVPSLEAALANKYGAMITPNRALDKRLLDAADFTGMVLHSQGEGQQPIYLQKPKRWARKYGPGAAGRRSCACWSK